MLFHRSLIRQQNNWWKAHWCEWRTLEIEDQASSQPGRKYKQEPLIMVWDGSGFLATRLLPNNVAKLAESHLSVLFPLISMSSSVFRSSSAPAPGRAGSSWTVKPVLRKMVFFSVSSDAQTRGGQRRSEDIGFTTRTVISSFTGETTGAPPVPGSPGGGHVPDQNHLAS